LSGGGTIPSLLNLDDVGRRVVEEIAFRRKLRGSLLSHLFSVHNEPQQQHFYDFGWTNFSEYRFFPYKALELPVRASQSIAIITNYQITHLKSSPREVNIHHCEIIDTRTHAHDAAAAAATTEFGSNSKINPSGSSIVANPSSGGGAVPTSMVTTPPAAFTLATILLTSSA
jgi:hypothetical protein